MDLTSGTGNSRTITLPLRKGHRLYVSQGGWNGGYGRGMFNVSVWLRSLIPSLPVQLFAVYLVLLSLHVLVAGRVKMFIVILQALLLTLLPRWSFNKLKMPVPRLLEWCTALIVMGTLILGELSHFYDLVWWWDIPLHALTGSVIAYVAYMLQQELYTGKHIGVPRVFVAIFSILISLGISGGWEIYEFSVDRLFATHMQPNGTDTMVDLVAGLFGAILGSLMGRR